MYRRLALLLRISKVYSGNFIQKTYKENNNKKYHSLRKTRLYGRGNLIPYFDPSSFFCRLHTFFLYVFSTIFLIRLRHVQYNAIHASCTAVVATLSVYQLYGTSTIMCGHGRAYDISLGATWCCGSLKSHGSAENVGIDSERGIISVASRHAASCSHPQPFVVAANHLCSNVFWTYHRRRGFSPNIPGGQGRHT